MSEEDYTWYGEPWRRLAAALIDLAILAVPTAAVALLLAAQAPAGEAWLGTLIVAGSGLVMFYKMVLEGSPVMATPGKLLMDLKVVGLFGEQLSYAACALRSWPFWLPGAMLGVTGELIELLILASLAALVIIPFTRRRQGLHDIMARAIIVHRDQVVTPTAAGDDDSYNP